MSPSSLLCWRFGASVGARPFKDKYVMATVLDSAEDCKREAVYGGALYKEGSKVVVDSSMVEAVSISGETYEIVLENYIVGLLE